MYLKNIEIQGFKSFANKINFDFHDGITAIVGPNGSGKSNVADAVRWVLGEQSAKTLRGSSMQDVIFAGSSERRQQSYASVSIILDNSDRALRVDFDEVVVSRRVYRSGESEYLLNGSVCRLRDVQELFYDTGIGKEGYSIIGQGQIDRILSEKPEGRRELFDEAAGIVKLKRNKAAALKKLEKERESLDRANDIINELGQRLPALEIESCRAKSFLQLRDSLRDKEIDFFNAGYERYQQEKKELDESLSTTEEQLSKSDKALAKVKQEYNGNQETLEALEEELSALSIRANDKELEAKQYEAQIILLNEQISTLNERSTDCMNRSLEDEELLKSRSEELATLTAANELKKREHDGLAEVLKGLELEFEELKNQINEVNASNEKQSGDIFELSGSLNSTMAVLDRNQSLLDEINLEISRLTDKKEELGLNLSDSRAVDHANEDRIAATAEEIDVLTAQISAGKAELDGLRDKEALLLNEKNRLIVEIDSQSSKRDILNAMLSSYEGYSNAIKKVMELKDSSVVGVVADIIDTPAGYETAIETALGAKIQNIIVDTDLTAKRMIELLKKNKYGRATFLPLNSLSYKEIGINKELLNEKGVRGYAFDIVSTDTEYRLLVKSLLGNVLVVDTIDNALKISKKYNNSIRMVTLQGELFSVGGSITGGDYKKNYNFLSRRSEIDLLSEGIKAGEEALGKNKQSLDELRVLMLENEGKKAKTELELANKNDEYNELKILQQKLKSILDTGENQLSEIDNEIKSKQNRADEILNEISTAEQFISSGRIRLNDMESRRADSQSSEDALKCRSIELAHCLEENRISLATAAQELSFNQASADKLREECDIIDERCKRLKNQAKGAGQEALNKEAEIAEVKQSIEACKTEHKELLQQISENGTRRVGISDRQKLLFKSLDDLNKEHQILSEELSRLGGSSERLESAIEYQLNYMWEEYELAIGDIAAFKKEKTDSINKLESDIKELKRTIKEFGNVNIGAIEELASVKERFDFLTLQKQDIEQSEQALVKLIEELDIGMSEQFKEKFKLIAEYFDKVFKKLFGGGHAGLTLVTPEDLLETGIIINVQPPGKKLQSMTVLSGGEKALTAIALLFAIQSLRPSPFCLLDEIEAALDDANVERFADYLKNLTDKTQFIIITHRKGTMSAADRLYGITMQEKGISALVSVNLVEKELG